MLCVMQYDLCMKKAHNLDAQWPQILGMLPVGFADNEHAKLALKRRRQVQTPADLLRLCLAYSVCDMSLRQTAVWAATIGLGDMSDVAVLKRLRGCSDWLGYILTRWLAERGLSTPKNGRKIRIIDASLIQTPGQATINYRVHLSMRLEPFEIQSVDVSDLKTGEHFNNYRFEPGEIAVADRVYAHANAITSVLSQGAHVVVRMHWRNLPLFSASGANIDLLSLFETLKEHEFGDWDVRIHHDNKSIPMRLIAIKKSEEAAKAEQKKLREHAANQSSKVDPRSYRAARYFYIVTDLSREDLPAVEAMEMYRMRWQIELVFKRLKSLLRMANLRAKDPLLVRTYILAKLLGALIIEELSGHAVLFFPWGFPLRAPSVEHLASSRPVGAVFMQQCEGNDES
jgi:hypothetical protein